MTTDYKFDIYLNMNSNHLILKLVSDTSEEALVAFSPESVETVVDGKPFYKKDVSQITMKSGQKFFVDYPFSDIMSKLKEKF